MAPKCFKGLLESLVHVKNLTLGSWALKVLSIMEMKGLHSPLSKCECLTLRTCIAKSVLPGIASLLESPSHLETLVIISMFSRTLPRRRFQFIEFFICCVFGTISPSPTFLMLMGRTTGHHKRGH
ncbi:hypothetical protein ACSBR1_006188 [Camellia fascicularis]